MKPIKGQVSEAVVPKKTWMVVMGLKYLVKYQNGMEEWVDSSFGPPVAVEEGDNINLNIGLRVLRIREHI